MTCEAAVSAQSLWSVREGIDKGEGIYPLTIIADRYSGAYAGERYAAFAMDPDCVPQEILGGDFPCREWWKENGKKWFVAAGKTPNAAEKALRLKIMGEKRTTP